LQTVFGWRVYVGPRANPRSLTNFPMQANGAEMLRLACCLATERGVAVCAPVHDALLLEGLTERQRPPRHKTGEWFLKGPIPGEWLTRAAGLSFRALRVGLALWYLAGLKKSRAVKPTWDTWRKFGLSPDGGRRGLAILEQAGLVSVDRQPGCCSVVKILGAALDLNARPV